MKPELRLLELPGKIIPISDLRIPKAKQFAKFLQEVGPEVFASLCFSEKGGST
jgi:hypothetical protein